MNGIHASTGKALTDDAHLAQSIGDILATPLGSRIMRRDYGSLLFELIDRPLNRAIGMLLQAATAIALRRWEPRLQLTRVHLAGKPEDGTLAIRIEGRRTDQPQATALTTFSIPISNIRGADARAAT